MIKVNYIYYENVGIFLSKKLSLIVESECINKNEKIYWLNKQTKSKDKDRILFFGIKKTINNICYKISDYRKLSSDFSKYKRTLAGNDKIINQKVKKDGT